MKDQLQWEGKKNKDNEKSSMSIMLKYVRRTVEHSTKEKSSEEEGVFVL